MPFPISDWSQALNLSERLGPDPAEAGEAASPEAVRRLARWQSGPSFAAPGMFERRLAAAGLTESLLLDLLAKDPKAAGARLDVPPRWMSDLQRLFPEPAAVGARETARPQGTSWQAAFAPALTPFLNDARIRLGEALAALAGQGRIDRARLELQCLAELRARLLFMASRTLALELNAASLLNTLPGVIPADRLQSFSTRLARPEARLALFQEYPVLSRQLAIHLHEWHAGCREVFQRLEKDWDALTRELGAGRDLGLLHRVRMMGDRHRGRCVALCTFSSGVTLVYKPRPVAVEASFQDLLGWLNDRGASPAFRRLKILDRETYGWAEMIPSASCESREEVERFYRRQGSGLAVLYALRATDIHADNVIACGEHPVIVDAETLFEAPLRHSRPDREQADPAAHSVLRTCLLPLPAPEGAGDPGEEPDLSGLGGIAGQLTAVPVPAWLGAGTNSMRLAYERQPLAPFQNRPKLQGADVDVSEFRDALLAGFTDTWRLLAAHREALLAPGGPIEAFARDEVRNVLRSTQLYVAMLDLSFHPMVLGDALERERLFDRLWLEASCRSELPAVAEAERADLWNNDVPIFNTRPCDVDLRTSTGKVLPGFFAETGLDAVRARIRSLSEEGLERQLAFVRASLPAGVTS